MLLRLKHFADRPTLLLICLCYQTLNWHPLCHLRRYPAAPPLSTSLSSGQTWTSGVTPSHPSPRTSSASSRSWRLLQARGIYPFIDYKAVLGAILEAFPKRVLEVVLVDRSLIDCWIWLFRHARLSTFEPDCRLRAVLEEYLKSVAVNPLLAYRCLIRIVVWIWVALKNQDCLAPHRWTQRPQRRP